MKGRYKINDIINYYLSKSAMTPKKLQKILYLAYSWYLALMNENKTDLNIKLFNETFEAWIHGPVCHKIYTKYKSYGGAPIPKFTGVLPEITKDDKQILDDVWDVYGEFTANDLESITHQHDPWKLARAKQNSSYFDWSDQPISDSDIFEYYSKQLVNE